MNNGNTRPLALWLFTVAAAVYIMILLGGATRLTGSGLSITEWKPILGVIPPLDDRDWQQAFEKYQQYPQYRIDNPDMSLAEFKGIYLWEYFHRLWGRAIALIFAVPLLVFWMQRRIPKGFGGKLIFLFVLGGLQGALGWFMVQSGLVDKPWVSPFRLMLHLLLALFLFSFLLWLALGLWAVRPGQRPPGLRLAGIVAHLLLMLLALQMALGALTSGLHAALVYPTFPAMAGHLVPPGLFNQAHWWLDFLQNAATAQFFHRWVGMLFAAGCLYFWFCSRSAVVSRRFTVARHLLAGLVLAQIVLGVVTLAHSLGRIPLHAALTHQGVAVALLAVLIVLFYDLRYGGPVVEK